MRVRIDLAYDGTRFNGSAIQPGCAPCRACSRPRSPTAAAAADAQVWARPHPTAGSTRADQVRALRPRRRRADGSVGRSTEARTPRLLRRLDRMLPDRPAHPSVAEAASRFDARFSAMSRRYAYRVVDDPDRVDPLSRRTCSSRSGPGPRCDERRIRAGPRRLHEFASICRRREGATTVRTLLDRHRCATTTVSPSPPCAPTHCHGMVRSIVGSRRGRGRGQPPRGPPGVLAWLAATTGMPWRIR